MHGLTKYTLIILQLILWGSCSNHFLDENLTSGSNPVGSSNIVVFPDQQPALFAFSLPGQQHGSYRVLSKPSWLTINPRSGLIDDSLAFVECSAKKEDTFNKAGFHLDFMTVEAAGTVYKVRVVYVNSGQPTVKVADNIVLFDYLTRYPHLTIQNTGPGLLLWEIVDLPTWLVIDTSRFDTGKTLLEESDSYDIPFVFNIKHVTTEDLTGNIVIATNDKAHPQVTVAASVEKGAPSLSVSKTTIDFTTTTSPIEITLRNNGNGNLIWAFEDIPNWLTIKPASGVFEQIISYGSIQFQCDRSKLPPGQQNVILSLKSNDANNPSQAILVKAVGPS